MTWREDLQRVRLADGRSVVGASFRGVPFLVSSSERGGGRRIVRHEFPGRDAPAFDDLGRATRTYQVDGYVLGDDYLEQRDALLAALEDEGGPGELVHPYHGVRQVVCTGLSVRETTVDGGMARFAITFEEVTGQALVPVEDVDLLADVQAAATAAQAATLEAFEAGYDVDGQPAFAIASLASELSAVSDGMADGLSGAVATTQELARLDVDIQAITDDAATLVRMPADTLGALISVVGNLADTIAAAPREVLRALLDAYDVPVQAVAQGSSATRALERANQAAIQGALRATMMVEAAGVIVQVDYEVLADALSDRDAVAARLAELALDARDESYAQLVALRSAVLRAIPGDAELARITTVTRRTAVPSLLLAYDLYGDVTRELALVARNGSQHPGFMAGDIEALSA